MSEIEANLHGVWSELERLLGSDRNTWPKVVAVSKGFSEKQVQTVRALGLEDFGESYSQEFLPKAQNLVGTDVRWHFIGGLQSNKIRKIAPHVSLWHSVDRIKTIDEIAKNASDSKIFLQVNLTKEPKKQGCDRKDIQGLLNHAGSRGLKVLGLMTMGPTDALNPAPAFSELAKLAKQFDLTELSMGMSNDYQIAVDHGATHLRLGSTIFGNRDLKG